MTIPRGYPVDRIQKRFSEPCPQCDVRAVVGRQHALQWECMSCGHVIALDRPVPAIEPDTVPWADYSEVVYYIRFGDRVKIGTTRNLSQRLLKLPHDEVLATEPGSYDIEGRRHRQLRRSLVKGQREWFHLTAEVRDHITSIQQP